VVTSRFNSEITDKLEEGAISYLEEVGGLDIHAVKVPGAVEVALGCVIRGDTSHYDLVCNSVERGVTALMLEYGRPIGFGVITTENEDQALDRAGGSQGNKGEEAAQVALEMLGLISDMKASQSKKKKKK